MKFTLNRNHILSSTSGHSIEFIKGELTHVPPGMYAEVMAIGALPEENLSEPTETASREPADPIARKTAIFAGFEQMVLAKKRDAFTGTGVPHAKALTAQIGFAIDNKERDTLWAEFNLAQKAD